MRVLIALSLITLAAACEDTRYGVGASIDSSGRVSPTISGSNGAISVAVSP